MAIKEVIQIGDPLLKRKAKVVSSIDSKKTKNLFEFLGFKKEILWLRKRIEFLWKDGVKVCLDDTQGYGYIIELEKMTTVEKSQETHQMLVREMEKLGIEITPKEEFQKKFEYYKKNWEKLIKE